MTPPPVQPLPPTPAAAIASGSGWDFVLVGEDVYRVRSGWTTDTKGFPMGARWECSRPHWVRFRAIYDWAQDVADGQA